MKQKDFGVNIPGMALQQIQGGIYARLPYEQLDKIIDRLMKEYGNGLYLYPFAKHLEIQEQLRSKSQLPKSNVKLPPPSSGSDLGVSQATEE